MAANCRLSDPTAGPISAGFLACGLSCQASASGSDPTLQALCVRRPDTGDTVEFRLHQRVPAGKGPYVWKSIILTFWGAELHGKRCKAFWHSQPGPVEPCCDAGPARCPSCASKFARLRIGSDCSSLTSALASTAEALGVRMQHPELFRTLAGYLYEILMLQHYPNDPERAIAVADGIERRLAAVWKTAA
jgi:hypothetical protein